MLGGSRVEFSPSASMFKQPFHPGTNQMLRAAQHLHRRVDPTGISAFEALLPRLFTARAEADALQLDSCGSQAARLLGLEGPGQDMLARFPSTDRNVLRLTLRQAGDTAVVAQVLARLPRRRAGQAELTLAPLLRRSDGSLAILGLLQPVREPWTGPLLELRLLGLHLAPQSSTPDLHLVVG